MTAGRATTVGALDTRLADFREEVGHRFEEVGRRFDDLGQRLDRMDVVHVDAYEADKRTADAERAGLDSRVKALEERNKRLLGWAVGLGVAIVGSLLSNIGFLVVHVH